MSFAQRRKFLWLLFLIGLGLIAIVGTPQLWCTCASSNWSAIPQPSHGCSALVPTREWKVGRSELTRASGYWKARKAIFPR